MLSKKATLLKSVSRLGDIKHHNSHTSGKKGATFNAFCKNTVFEHNAGKNEIHPTQKPLSLWYELIRDNSNEGQLVFDPCAGSGTTAVACHKLKRDFICFEVNKDYYDAASKRLNAVKDQFSMFDINNYDSIHDAVLDAQREDLCQK